MDHRKYIMLALIWSYVFWLPAAVISHINPGWHGTTALHIAGGTGPLLAAIYVVIANGRIKEFFRRLIRIRDIRPLGWLFILMPVCVVFISSFIIAGELVIDKNFISAGILYPVILFFFGPLPEELGWRGVLFDSLSKKSFWKAQSATAGIWLIWHLPLFFINGSYQNGLGILTWGFVLWCSELIIQSLIMGHIYIYTNRSIASAVLFHYFVNLAGEFLERTESAQILSISLYLVFFMILIVVRKYHDTGQYRTV